jgi:hypothetical protein
MLRVESGRKIYRSASVKTIQFAAEYVYKLWSNCTRLRWKFTSEVL